MLIASVIVTSIPPLTKELRSVGHQIGFRVFNRCVGEGAVAVIAITRQLSNRSCIRDDDFCQQQRMNLYWLRGCWQCLRSRRS